jgi:hypothetical protein
MLFRNKPSFLFPHSALPNKVNFLLFFSVFAVCGLCDLKTLLYTVLVQKLYRDGILEWHIK